MGSEHDAAVLRDVDDAVLGLDGHPTQLDVLRVGRAHACVLLDGRHVEGKMVKIFTIWKEHVCISVFLSIQR